MLSEIGIRQFFGLTVTLGLILGLYFFNMVVHQTKFFAISSLGIFSENKVDKVITIHYHNKPEFISPDVFSKCEYKCNMTYNQANNESVKFVVFFAPRIHRIRRPQKYDGQVWILHTTESVANFEKLSDEWKNSFNWTMGYRRDSDILDLYGKFQMKKRTLKNSTDMEKMLPSKQNKGAWFVSNCVTTSKRFLYMKELNKSVHLDVYGACKNALKCPRAVESNCLKLLKTTYKFYTSFENSLCRDYITEKSFKIYKNMVNVIPVTRGTINEYPLYLPPGSFLNTKDFATVKDLATYLQEQIKNEANFLKYFEWRKHYQVSEKLVEDALCELCKRAHDPVQHKGLYPDVNVFHRGDSLHGVQLGCVKPSDI